MKKICLLAMCLASVSVFAGGKKGSMVFIEDFEGDKLNTKVWNVEDNIRGGGNAEMQYYCPDNVTIEKAPTGESCLVLTAKDEFKNNRPVTSGRVNTLGKFSFLYGTMELRVMFPKTADGLWPAIWMLGDNLAPDLGDDDSIDKQKRNLKKKGYVVWPKCGEIDLMEMGHADGIKNGNQDRYFNGACHWGEDFNNGSYPNLVMNKEMPYSLQDGKFHIITLEWSKNAIKMYIDREQNPDMEPYFSINIGGKKKKDAPARYFNHPFSLVMNLAVGGYFTGLPAPEKYPVVISPEWENYQKIKSTALKNGEAKLYIDYIKIYK